MKNLTEIQLKVFIEQVQKIASEWTKAVANEEDVHPKYSDQIFQIHEIIENIVTSEEEELEGKKEQGED